MVSKFFKPNYLRLSRKYVIPGTNPVQHFYVPCPTVEKLAYTLKNLKLKAVICCSSDTVRIQLENELKTKYGVSAVVTWFYSIYQSTNRHILVDDGQFFHSRFQNISGVKPIIHWDMPRGGLGLYRDRIKFLSEGDKMSFLMGWNENPMVEVIKRTYGLEIPTITIEQMIEIVAKENAYLDS